MTPKVLLVAKDGRTFDVFYSQLHDYFQDSVSIVGEQEVDSYHEIDLILVSSSQLIKGKDYPSEKLLVARRAINIAKLEQLVALPAGTRCLVINNMPETARETMELLMNLGFDLEMHLYFPGAVAPPAGIDVAVIPAGVELVPKGIKSIIDIGIRPMDFSTIVEIAVKLNLHVDKANIYSARYTREIIGLSHRLANTLNHVKQLNHQLDAILNTVHDGIIATDSSGNIIKINKAAQKILGINLPVNEMLGKQMGEMFPKLKLDGNKEEQQENILCSLNGIQLVVNRTPIRINQDKIGVVTAFQDVTEIQKLEQDLRKELQTKGFSIQYTIRHVIGKSERMKETIKTVQKISRTDRTVLILGENGTGKELFAHSIHDLSLRRNGPFLPVNFAGLPETLAESELFGYEDGAFTGAKKGGKPGLFELAHNGTLFLDEIGDASPSIQALLLRVLQERQVMRIGGHRVIPVNVRVIAATNRDLRKMVEEGKFRQDLYYRLFVLPIRIPPLRERKEDIPLLIEHFIREYCPVKIQIQDDVMQKLVHYQWPGNVRELASVVQYMTSVMEGNQVTVEDLPEQFWLEADSHRQSKNATVDILEKEGDLLDFYMILSCLEQAKLNREGVGRGRIVEYSRQMGIPLTDQQVRRRMEVLREHGLLHSGIKGQGSRITSNGLAVLETVRAKVNLDIARE